MISPGRPLLRTTVLSTGAVMTAGAADAIWVLPRQSTTSRTRQRIVRLCKKNEPMGTLPAVGGPIVGPCMRHRGGVAVRRVTDALARCVVIGHSFSCMGAAA